MIKAGTLGLARWIEAATAIVIANASLRVLSKSLYTIIADRSLIIPKEEIRLSLGHSLALALELELGTYILKKAVVPS